ncbi:MAG: hypothetical protein WC647_14155 [Desulfomonilaceae bacterium]
MKNLALEPFKKIVSGTYHRWREANSHSYERLARKNLKRGLLRMGLSSNPVKEFASSQFLPESSLDTLNACALISEAHIVDVTHLLIIGRSDMTRKEATDAI